MFQKNSFIHLQNKPLSPSGFSEFQVTWMMEWGQKSKPKKIHGKKLTPQKWFPWSIIITWILEYPLGCYVSSTTEIQLCNLILLSMLLCTVYHASKRFYKTFLFSCYSWMKQHRLKICKIYFKRILPWRYWQ